jgi:hypothetical protein
MTLTCRYGVADAEEGGAVIPDTEAGNVHETVFQTELELAPDFGPAPLYPLNFA